MKRLYEYEIKLERRFVAEAEATTTEHPAEVAKVLTDLGICDRPQEQFWTLHLNSKLEVTGKEVISIGSINRSMASPADVFRGAIVKGTAAIVIAHNHPSGDTSPSDADRKTTQTLKECGELLGIKVLDHIILSEQGYYSFAEHGEI